MSTLYVYRILQNYAEFDTNKILVVDFTSNHFREYANADNFAKGYKKYYDLFHEKYEFDSILFVFGNDLESSRAEVPFLVTPHRIKHCKRDMCQEHLIIPVSSLRPKTALRKSPRKKSVRRSRRRV